MSGLRIEDLALDSWSVPIRLNDALERRIWIQIPLGASGVYRLVALGSATSLEPASLNRVCGIDDSGTLYIGVSKKLRDRVGGLIKSFRPSIPDKEHKQKTHKLISPKISEIFGLTKLAITWKQIDRELCFHAEAALLKDYESEFGEMPPHNHIGGSQYYKAFEI